jgi:hypothetical protein
MDRRDEARSTGAAAAHRRDRITSGCSAADGGERSCRRARTPASVGSRSQRSDRPATSRARRRRRTISGRIAAPGAGKPATERATDALLENGSSTRRSDAGTPEHAARIFRYRGRRFTGPTGTVFCCRQRPAVGSGPICHCLSRRGSGGGSGPLCHRPCEGREAPLRRAWGEHAGWPPAWRSRAAGHRRSHDPGDHRPRRRACRGPAAAAHNRAPLGTHHEPRGLPAPSRDARGR